MKTENSSYSFVKKKYYSIHEVLKILEKNGKPQTHEELRSLVREELIHPVVYIDSFPVHACTLNDNKEGIALGFCYLSAYWDIKDEIIVVFDELMHKSKIPINYIIRSVELISAPKIISWQFDISFFKKVPENHRKPTPFSSNLEITHFTILPEYNFFDIKNIVISHKDLEFLLNSLMVEQKNNSSVAIGDEVKRYLLKISREGGKKSTKDPALLCLACHLLQKMGGYSNFVNHLKKNGFYYDSLDDYQIEKESYESGCGECEDLYITNDESGLSTLHYTSRLNKTDEKKLIKLSSVKRYFTEAKKILNSASSVKF